VLLLLLFLLVLVSLVLPLFVLVLSLAAVLDLLSCFALSRYLFHCAIDTASKKLQCLEFQFTNANMTRLAGFLKGESGFEKSI
jgi:hypothetical protein